MCRYHIYPSKPGWKVVDGKIVSLGSAFGFWLEEDWEIWALFVMRKTCMLFTMFVAWFGSFFRGMLTAKPWYWYQGIPLCFGSGIVLRLAMTDVEVLAHWDANFHVVRPLIRDHRGDQPLWSFWTELFCLLNWTVVYPWGWYIYHEMVDFYGIN